MIKAIRQLKDRIRNLSKENTVNTQILLRNYMMERSLRRISTSEYRDKLILEGGMLVSVMVGLASRSTMDINTAIKGEIFGIDEVEHIITATIAVPMGDSVEFHIKRVPKTTDEAKRPGVRVSMETGFDGVRVPLKINISAGNAIVLREMRYSFKLILGNRDIDAWAYNLGTVLTEELKAVISRATTSTRMRGSYDSRILHQLYGRELIPISFHMAPVTTAKKHGTEKHLPDTFVVSDEVEADFNMEKQWKSYQKEFPCAADLAREVVMTSIRDIYKRTRT